MAADYHIHSVRCGHAKGKMVDYVRKAEEIGLREVGFADHMPLLHTVDEHLSMSRDELPEYVNDVQELGRSADLPVKLGIEADWVPETATKLAELIGAYPFDYVLGSVHFIDGWGFDDPRHVAGYEGKDPQDVYRRYFEAVVDAAGSGLFDVLAHPDLIKKFGILPPIDLSAHYEDVARAAAAADIAVEVSTAGLRKPVGEIYPTVEFLKVCRRLGVPVCLGSDAHAPEEVGYRFDAAARLLADVGYSEVAVFSARERSSMPIGGGVTRP